MHFQTLKKNQNVMLFYLAIAIRFSNFHRLRHGILPNDNISLYENRKHCLDKYT
jgi:hypothetical protein